MRKGCRRGIAGLRRRLSGPVLLLIGAGLASVAAAEGPTLPDDGVRTRVVVLGSGTPNADPERMGPSLAIVVDDTPYIVDAGPGVVRRAALAAGTIPGLAPPRLATLFVTHLHSDHTAGIPDLWLTPWVLTRQVPFRVLGPIGTERMMGHLREAYLPDLHNRLYGLEPANDQGHRIIATDVEPGLVHEDDLVRVYAFEVNHGTWPRSQSYGYRFETPDRTIVVSGDAAPSESIVEMCDGCDVLVHEAYARVGWETRSEEWKTYHAASHTSGVEVGELAARARPGLLVLTHLLLWGGATTEDLVEEVRLNFDGPVVAASDLDVF